MNDKLAQLERRIEDQERRLEALEARVERLTTRAEPPPRPPESTPTPTNASTGGGAKLVVTSLGGLFEPERQAYELKSRGFVRDGPDWVFHGSEDQVRARRRWAENARGMTTREASA